MTKAEAARKPYVKDGLGHLPVLSRASEVLAWAVVDAVDFPRLAKHTWRLHSSGTAIFCSGSREHFTTLSLGRAVLKLPAVGRPRVSHADGDALNCTRANLRLPRSWLASPDNDGTSFAVATVKASLRLNAVLLNRHRQGARRAA